MPREILLILLGRHRLVEVNSQVYKVFHCPMAIIAVKPQKPHRVMSSGLLQITAEFTEHSIANVASECERPSCSTIIHPGEKHFYLAPDAKPNSPGRHVCEPCFQYYLKKRSTTARVVPTATNSGKSSKFGSC